MQDNNTTANTATYEEKRTELRQKSLDMVSQINKVIGFSPESLSETYTDERFDGKEMTYLPLEHKKAWFRMVYPQGRIVAKSLGYNEESGYVEAKAYVYAGNTAEEMPIGEGHVFLLSVSSNPKDVSDAILLAEGSAKSRALYEAGFGLQFYRDAEDDDVSRQIMQTKIEDNSLADWQAGVKATQDAPKAPEATTTPSNRRGAVEIVDDCNAKLLYIKQRAEAGESYEALNDEYNQVVKELNKQLNKKVVKEAIKKGVLHVVRFELKDVCNVEEMPKFASVDEAKAFNSTHKAYAGKTLGEIYESKPHSLFTLYERVESVEEKEAIKVIVNSDADLIAYAERNNKVLN